MPNQDRSAWLKKGHRGETWDLPRQILPIEDLKSGKRTFNANPFGSPNQMGLLGRCRIREHRVNQGVAPVRSITVQVSEEVARKLASEALLRKLTIEELAAERLTSPPPQTKIVDREVKKPKTDYLELAESASRAPSARKSFEEIDADIEASRNEW